MTVFVWPSDDRPAVRAKGTVNPSAKPRVKLERRLRRGGICILVGDQDVAGADRTALYLATRLATKIRRKRA
jgi:hypothetical protein